MSKQAIDTKEWSSCPKCGEAHDDGSGETIDSKWSPRRDDFGGDGYRLFDCKKCGQLLKDDISN